MIQANIMDQYRPCGRAVELSEINRQLCREEYEGALRLVAEAGLDRLDERDWRRLIPQLI